MRAGRTPWLRWMDRCNGGSTTRGDGAHDCSTSPGSTCTPGAGARVSGLEAVPAGDPLAAGGGTDNRVAIWSDRYRERPVLIQGPGAGAGVTAAALLDDALQVVREVARGAPGLSAARVPALAPA